MPSVNLGTLSVKLGADTSQLDKGVEDSKRKLTEFDSKAKDSSLVSSSAFRNLSVAAVAALGVISYAIKSVVDSMTDMGRNAAALGLTAQAFSRLEYATKTTGVGIDQLKGSLNSLIRRMQETEAVSEGVRIFHALGVNVETTGGKLKNVDQVLLELADKFKNTRDGVEKTNIAISLFGDAGTALIPILNRGSASLQALMAESDRLGATLDEKTISATTRLSESWARLSAAAGTVANRIAASIAPTLQKYTDAATEAATKTEHLDMVVTAVSKTFTVLDSIVTAIGAALGNIGTILRSTVQAMLALITGDFKGAMDVLSGSLTEIVNRSKTATDSIIGMWTTTTVAATEGAKNAGIAAGQWKTSVELPVVESAERVAAALQGMRTMGQIALQDVFLDPSINTFTQKMERLKELVAQGSIGFREFELAVKQATDGNRQNILDLGTQVASTLTTVFNKSKIAAIASAVINTAVGITKALSTLPPPFSFAMAGLVAASGAAQIAQIQAQSETGGGSTTPSVGGGSSPSQPPPGASGSNQSLYIEGLDPTALYSGEAVRNLAEKLLQFQADGGKVILDPV